MTRTDTQAYAEIFPWDDNFSTGIADIDEQHQHLVSLVNKLGRHVATESADLTLEEVIGELTDYTQYHFSSEEELWLEYLPEDNRTRKHLRTHQGFIQEIQQIKSEVGKLGKEEIIDEVLAFLTHWLAFHILNIDRRMAKVVLAIRQGMTPEQAKQQADREMSGSTRQLVEAILKMYQSLSSRTLELMREITHRHRAEQKLLLSKNVIDSTMESIFITDAEGMLIDANPSFCADARCDYEQLLGRDIRQVKPSLFDLDNAPDVWTEAREQGHWAGEIMGKDARGNTEAVWLTLSAVRDGRGRITHYAGVLSSVSHLIERQHNLEQEVNHDALTGLPNRRLLNDRLSQALVRHRRSGKRLAVCFIDLDGFKQVNDSLGHKAGDVLLRSVAGRLNEQLRGEDTVARLGGDEFVLLLGDLGSTEDAASMLDRILRGLEEPVPIDGEHARVSGSIGVTFHPDDAGTPEELLQHADEAMYTAKHAGKSRYHVWSQA